MGDRGDLYWIAEADMDLLRLYLDEPCSFDTHGRCQAHALTLGRDGLCGIGRVLTAMKVEPLEATDGKVEPCQHGYTNDHPTFEWYQPGGPMGSSGLYWMNGMCDGKPEATDG